MSVPGLAILYSGLMKRKWAVNSALMVLYAFGATLIVWTLFAFKMSFGTQATDILHFVGIPGTILSPSDLQGQAVIPLLKRSEEHTSELQSHSDLVCRLLPE